MEIKEIINIIIEDIYVTNFYDIIVKKIFCVIIIIILSIIIYN